MSVDKAKTGAYRRIGCFIMKYQTFAMIGLLVVTSCASQPNLPQPNVDSAGTRANAVLKNQEAIAGEIGLHASSEEFPEALPRDSWHGRAARLLHPI